MPDEPLDILHAEAFWLQDLLHKRRRRGDPGFGGRAKHIPRSLCDRLTAGMNPKLLLLPVEQQAKIGLSVLIETAFASFLVRERATGKKVIEIHVPFCVSIFLFGDRFAVN